MHPSPAPTTSRRTPLLVRVLIGCVIAAGVFVALNTDYFWARVRYAVSNGPEMTEATEAAPAPVDTIEPPAEPATATGPRPQGTAAAPTTPKERQPASSQRVRIASLGIDAPLVYDVGGTSEAAFQKALRRGVVHYPGSALPGELGNAYFFGHSSDYAWAQGSYKTVFALLPKIKVGDRVEIASADGTTQTFVVREAKVVAKDDRTVLSQGGRKKRMLTLQTSYPVGTALKRFVAVAELE
jgi:LPXTG-site transpeptidase (sortase) family protein